jgi:hypothetical protein
MAELAHAAVQRMRSASAGACALAGAAVERVIVPAITKPIQAMAKHPKSTKAALGGAAAAPFVADYFGDEDDGFDEEEEVAQP